MSRLLLAGIVVFASAATAVAAGAAPSPKVLALRLSDFPRNARALVVSDDSGPGGSVYAAAFSFKAGGREEVVTDSVWFVPKNAKPPVPGLVAGPQSTYRSTVGQNSGFRGETALTVPRYGDEQTANWADYRNADGAERARTALVVRKGSVIWALTVEDCGVLAPAACVFGPTPPKISRSQSLAELKRYARKQKARIGNG